MGEGDQVREDQTGVKRGITVPQSLLLRADREEIMTLRATGQVLAALGICTRIRPQAGPVFY